MEYKSVITTLIIIGGIGGCSAAYNFGPTKTKIITVEETFMMRGHNEPDQMLVRSTSGDLYSVDDSLIRWEFKSADLWSEMSSGETWEVSHFGWRIGFFSSFPQIFEGREITNAI
ncbi:MAG: hypothetical protein H8E12_09050 [Rhodobacteraceae bacterium]|nr:hypothetical protein [Paracoccaceae bacterium]